MTLTAHRPAGIADRLDALDRVLALTRGRVDDTVLQRFEQVAGKAGDRLRFGAGHTVVALAGATGSGKSSLFNLLAGADLSQVGLRRPTTGTAHAAVWGAEPAGALLDWLQVPRRHQLAGPPGGGPAGVAGPDGLVLLDLPDVDSVERQHRRQADRLVEQVDLLVWVLDPQKYADAAVHDRYLAPLAGHADVMIVLLNQVDRLPAPARERCLADLRRLLASEGLGAVPVLAVSARTGAGIDQLRLELARRAAAKQATVGRLEADLAALAGVLEPLCAGTAGAGVADAERDALVRALAEAAGTALVADAVAGTYRLRAHRATGWPFTRWTSRLRRDPARRLRLRDSPSELVRTSVPAPSAVARARVDTALRELAERAGQGLPPPWIAAVRRAAGSGRSELPDELDRAVAGTDLGLARRPLWWRAAAGIQSLAGLAVVVGAAWLLALFVLAWLQLPAPPLPHLGRLPVPTLLLGGGVLAGLLVAWVSGLCARVGAGRARVRARRRLDEQVARVARDVVIGPVERELAAHTELCRALDRVRGR